MIKIAPAKITHKIKYAIRDIVLQAKALEKKGHKMTYLNIGDPILHGYKTPRHMIEIMYKKMLAGYNSYAPSSGISEAIEAIRQSALNKKIRNIQEIFISSGGSEAIDICLAALLNVGEQVLTPNPGYPLFTSVIARCRGVSVPYRLTENNGWLPDLDDLSRHITPRTRALVMINPNNPTGSVYPLEILKGILQLAQRHNLVIIADETYDTLIFDHLKHIPIASLKHQFPIVTINSLSKSFLAPGWRMGCAIITGDRRIVKDYTEAILKFTRARLCANHPAQFAVKSALEGSKNHLDQMVSELWKNRDWVVNILNSTPGIQCSKPQGAFYAYPSLTGWKGTDKEFVVKLMEETGIVVVPGSGFGESPGKKYFRMVFLPRGNKLKVALDKIKKFAEKWMG